MRERKNEPIDASFTMVGEEVPEVSEVEETSLITIKPFRLILLLLILFAMLTHRIPFWFGGGILVLYFGIKIAIKRFVTRLLMMPLALKGKALAGATVEVHGYEWTESPHGETRSSDDIALRYVWIEATVAPPEHSEGFVHWEPSELVLCPTWFTIKQVSDLDVCLAVEDVQYLQGEGSIDDGNCAGTQRLRLLVGIPEGEYAFNFVYYLEVFGEINLAD